MKKFVVKSTSLRGLDKTAGSLEVSESEIISALTNEPKKISFGKSFLQVLKENPESVITIETNGIDPKLILYPVEELKKLLNKKK